MRSLFRKSPTTLAAKQNAQAQLEKLLAESLRTLGQLFTRLADVMEAERLERQGFGEQGRFLERLDQKSGSEKR